MSKVNPLKKQTENRQKPLTKEYYDKAREKILALQKKGTNATPSNTNQKGDL
jgi:hypothetical protein